MARKRRTGHHVPPSSKSPHDPAGKHEGCRLPDPVSRRGLAGDHGGDIARDALCLSASPVRIGDVVPAPTMTSMPPCRRVLLLRHGHYLRDGHTSDPGYRLSPLGRRQAVRLGRHLREILASSDAAFEGLYTSPWARARETAEIVGHETGISTLRIKPYLHETIPLPPPGDATPAVPNHVRRAVVHQVDRARRRFLRPATRNEIVLVASHG
ncbi:MAG: hypothetical protein D6705_06360, partial [Deltaproteobacteria bacterium]